MGREKGLQMLKHYRVILQIKDQGAEGGYSFRLWDAENKNFTLLPKSGTYIRFDSAAAEEVIAKKEAEELFRGSDLEYFLRCESIPPDFRLIQAAGV